MAHRPLPAALALLLLLAACSDAPGPLPAGGADLCNAAQEALTEARCQLALAEDLERFLSYDGDADWYLLTLPAQLPSPALLRVGAGGGEGRTAVRLDVRVLREDGTTPVGRGVTGATGGPVELLLPWAEPGARLLLAVTHDRDAGLPAFDTARPYALRAELLQDPDGNEPNDEQPTPLALTAQPDGTLRGAAQGVLASQGDVDRYAFSLTSGQRVQVLYLQLTAPQRAPSAAAPLRYVLTQQGAGELAGGEAPAGNAPVRLATARTVGPVPVPSAPLTTQYLLEVRAADAAAPGDLRHVYAVELRVLEREDAHEPNDAPEAAALEQFASPGAGVRTLTGRLETAGDEDWLAVDLPALTRPTVLRYRLLPRDAGGRFPPLAEPDRVLSVRTGLAQAASCAAPSAACPGAPTTPLATAAHQEACARATPQCLHALRGEAADFALLRNFEGVLAVPGHTGAVRYLFRLASAGGHYADDREYALELAWEEDPDEAARAGSGADAEGTPALLAEDTREGAGIAPPAGGAFEVQGTLLAGHGLRSAGAASGGGVRAPEDYDAVPTDVDLFRFQLPTGLMAPQDRTWKLQWEVAHAPGAGAPAALALDLTFCDGEVASSSGCVPVSVGSKGSPLTLRHLPAPQLPWHAPQTGTGPLRLTHEEVDAAAGRTTVTLTEEACPCLEPRFVRGGTLLLKVSALDRTSYAPARYTLRTAWAAYPRLFLSSSGAQTQCPAQCAFTREP